LYTKKDDNLQLGPAKLETIIYHFFQDKFFAVSLHSKDRDNTDATDANSGSAKTNGAEQLEIRVQKVQEQLSQSPRAEVNPGDNSAPNVQPMWWGNWHNWHPGWGWRNWQLG
jgi:hypothetical protein